MKIVFFGTSHFAAEILGSLIQANQDVVAIVTQPDRPKGRSGTPTPPPVKAYAIEHDLSMPLHQPQKASAPEFAEVLAAYDADLFVVVAYGEIIRDNLLQMPRLGCINIHASLLPKLRGAAPIQRAIMNGETESGVTIMYMVRKMDAGDMIAKATVPIGPNTTFEELDRSLCESAKPLLLSVIAEMEQGPIQAEAQDHEQATLAPKILPDDLEINWSLPAQQIHNLVRGVSPRPGAWCFVTINNKKKRLKVLRTELIEQSDQPGTVLEMGKQGIVVACGEDAVRLITVQPEGKRAMPCGQFAQGLQVVSFV